MKSFFCTAPSCKSAADAEAPGAALAAGCKPQPPTGAEAEAEDELNEEDEEELNVDECDREEGPADCDACFCDAAVGWKSSSSSAEYLAPAFAGAS